MLKRVSAVILAAVFLAVSMSGCYDAIEVDDEVYTMAIGVDKGVNNKIRVTIQYPTYKSGGGGGGGQSQGDNKGGIGSSNAAQGSNIHTIESSTILEALDMFGMAISRRVSLMHTKDLVFSEDFAKAGVGEYIAPLARFRETRRVMNVIVVRGLASDFIKENKSNIGDSLAKTMELMSVQADNTSFFPRATFHDFYRGILSSFEQSYTAYAGINDFKKLREEKQTGKPPLVIDEGFLPGELPREGVATREFVGTAVFDGDKMIGTLDSDETRYFLMALGKFKRGIMDFEDKKSPGAAIPLDIRPSRHNVIKGHFENGKPVIDIKIQLEADIGAIQSRIDYEKYEKIEELNKQAQEHIQKKIVELIDKVQKEYKTDIFSFGHKFAGYFPTIQEWEKYNWLSHFQEAKVNVKVEMNIRRTGLMINSYKIRSVGSK